MVISIDQANLRFKKTGIFQVRLCGAAQLWIDKQKKLPKISEKLL